MPGRIIYLQNPTAGSHFRTIGGKSTTKHTTTGRRRTGTGTGTGTGSTPGTFVGTGGARYKSVDPSWAIGNTPYTPHPSGSYTGRGRGPYEMDLSPDWVEPEMLFQQLLLIALGIDPYSGAPIPMWGEPGWVPVNFLNPSGEGNSYPFGKPREAGLIQNRWNPLRSITNPKQE
jgi:hypothetical protein